MSLFLSNYEIFWKPCPFLSLNELLICSVSPREGQKTSFVISMSPTAFPSCYAPHKNHKTGYIIFITQMLQNSAYTSNKMN